MRTRVGAPITNSEELLGVVVVVVEGEEGGEEGVGARKTLLNRWRVVFLCFFLSVSWGGRGEELVMGQEGREQGEEQMQEEGEGRAEYEAEEGMAGEGVEDKGGEEEAEVVN